MRTFLQIKALAARMQTTDVQVVIRAIDRLASQEKIVVAYTEKAKRLLAELSPTQAEALRRLLNNDAYDRTAIARLKIQLGKQSLPDHRFREYIYYDRAIGAEDFEVC